MVWRKEQALVVLVAVDEVVLGALVHAATKDAAADEVTPPLTAGPAWTAPRVAWLRAFHRDRRAGLAGACGEATWAVVVDEQVVGSVRLRRTEQQGLLETGAWLTRSARGRGRGSEVLAAVLQEAEAAGARVVRADTTSENASALGVLRRLGFDLTPAENGPDVQALLSLDYDHLPDQRQ